MKLRAQSLGNGVKQSVAVLILAMTGTVVSFASESLPTFPERGKALLVGGIYFPWLYNGTYTPWIRVIFRLVDDSPSPSRTALTLAPGHHTLRVQCEVIDPRTDPPVTTEVLWGILVDDVAADTRYKVMGHPNDSDRYCAVSLLAATD